MVLLDILGAKGEIVNISGCIEKCLFSLIINTYPPVSISFLLLHFAVAAFHQSLQSHHPFAHARGSRQVRIGDLKQ